MSNRSKLGAILTSRCPRCREGKIFKHSPANLSKFSDMYDDCPVCGLHYEVEVGFFWGAMYVSYAFSVAIVLVVGVLLYYLANDPEVWVYIAAVAGTVLLLTPVNFRMARVLMLHLFSGVRYNPNAAKR